MDNLTDAVAQLEAELRAIDARRPILVRAITALRGLAAGPGESVSPRLNGERRAPGTLAPAILDLMDQHPDGLRTGDFVRLMHASPTSISQKLSQMLHQGKVRRISRGVWGRA